MVGEPLMMILPPVAVPAAALLPAFSTTAESKVLSVAMFCERVKSLDRVSINTSPVAVIPVAPTVPISKAPAFTKLTLPSLVAPSPPARVFTLLPEFVRLKAPVPCKPIPSAVIAADCVNAVEL